MIEVLTNFGELIVPDAATVRRRERLTKAVDNYPPAYTSEVWAGFIRGTLNNGSIHAHAPDRIATRSVAFSAWHEGYSAFVPNNFRVEELA